MRSSGGTLRGDTVAIITAKITEEVRVEIVETIAADFADWLDSNGYEIAEKPGKQPSTETWDYASLANVYAVWKESQ